MTSTSLVAAYPPPPAQIQAYIEILGLDLTVDFLLAFGGAELHLSRDPKGKFRLSALVGPERAKALGQVTPLAAPGAAGKATKIRRPPVIWHGKACPWLKSPGPCGRLIPPFAAG